MRANYLRAIRWIIDNDDHEWLDDPHGSISVTAALVADMFGKTDEQVTNALRGEKARLAKAGVE